MKPTIIIILLSMSGCIERSVYDDGYRSSHIYAKNHSWRIISPVGSRSFLRFHEDIHQCSQVSTPQLLLNATRVVIKCECFFEFGIMICCPNVEEEPNSIGLVSSIPQIYIFIPSLVAPNKVLLSGVAKINRPDQGTNGMPEAGLTGLIGASGFKRGRWLSVEGASEL